MLWVWRDSIQKSGGITNSAYINSIFTYNEDVGTLSYEEVFAFDYLKSGTYDLAFSDDDGETWIDTGYDVEEKYNA